MHHKNKMDGCTDRRISRRIDMRKRKWSKMLRVEPRWTGFRHSLKNSNFALRLEIFIIKWEKDIKRKRVISPLS